MPMELCAPMVSETELSCVLLWDDEAEQAQVPQALNELRRLFGREIPALEIPMLFAQELVDGIDHHSQHFAVLVPQPRVGEKLLFEDFPRHQIFGDAHGDYCATRSMTRSRTPSRPTS